MKCHACMIIVLSTCAGLVETRAQDPVPVSTAFTYQGQLKQNGIPVNGECQFVFTLWNDPELDDPFDNHVGRQVAFLAPDTIRVVDGIFQAPLDFVTVQDNDPNPNGIPAFNGEPRWLSIFVLCPGGQGRLLSPRQEIFPAPASLHALKSSESLLSLQSLESLQTRGLFVDEAGNVGIGTLVPEAPLHVGEATRIDGPLTVTDTSQGSEPSDSALVVAGGAHIGGHSTFEAGLDVEGLLSVNGTIYTTDRLVVTGKILGLDGFNLIGDLSVRANVAGEYAAEFYNDNQDGHGILLFGDMDVRVSKAEDYAAEFTNNDQDGRGIAIILGRDVPDSNNDFITFANSSRQSIGRIEGQTLSELSSSFQYVWNITMAALDESFILAEGVACAAQLDVGEVAVMAAQGALVFAKWAQLENNLEAKLGVAYQSGSGDYAEWLEKADLKEGFTSGDIVGVRAGKISKNTDRAEHYMVISTSPIVLGNMPIESRKSNFEMVAFMGQVQVKVTGSVKKGDYIIPSSRNDGFGIAVSPKDMSLPDYEHIVGVAWSGSVGKERVSLINTAVGINTNDLVAQVIRQQEEINSVKRNLDSIVGYLQSNDPSFQAELFDVGPVAEVRTVADVAASANLAASANVKPAVSYTAMTPKERRSYFMTIVKENPDVLESIMADARETVTARGIDFNKFDQTRKILTDPEYLMEMLEQFGTSK